MRDRIAVIDCHACGFQHMVGEGFAQRARVLPCQGCGRDIDCRDLKPDNDVWTFMPDEDWPPYKWLWSRTAGRPFTHVMRDNPSPALSGFVLLVGTLLWVLWRSSREWRPILAFVAGWAIGFLMGHVWW